MAEGVISSIARKIVVTLVPQALENVGNLRGVKHELIVLRGIVSKLWALLEDAEEQYYRSHQIQAWVHKLKDTFYDTQDVLEDLNRQVMQQEFRGNNVMKEVRTFFSSSNRFIFKMKMSHKLRALRERIEEFTACGRSSLEERIVDLEVEWPRRKGEKTNSSICEGKIMGREEEKQNIMSSLLDIDMNEDVSILPIVGTYGIGKTALAQYVYNDEMVTEHFDMKMWVDASDNFNVKRIMKNMILCAKKKVPIEATMEWLQSELRRQIGGMRYLLVLDDLQVTQQESWWSLRDLLVGGAKGSKILITTRYFATANITRTIGPHILSNLSESASLDLLMQMAGQESDYDKLAIGKEIVRKCSGIPLAIRTVGKLLFFKKDASEWLHFKDHELPQASQMERIEATRTNRGTLLDEWGKIEDTHSFVHEEGIMGRDDDKKMIQNFLLDLDMKEVVAILPIVGISGLGKTALARCVFNDEMVDKQFQLKMWVCVSDGFDMEKIVKDMISYAKNKEPTEAVMEQLQSELRGKINGKRYLLVLDDLWNVQRESWRGLKDVLEGGARGSKILITTRFSLIAKITRTVEPYFLGSLSDNVSLNLLMQMAGQIENIQDPDMLVIGKEIIRKCSGIPLAIRTIGKLLFFKKTKLQWLHFKDHELPQVSCSGQNMINVLKLSYDHLPSHLKQCFAFCSLFPKDYEIEKQTLIDLWVAEGFIDQSHGSPPLEDIADQYFNDLLWGNFFQDFRKDSFTNKETCKMPALMHDLACSVAGFDTIAWDDDKSIHERTCHISHGLTVNLMGKLPILHLKTSTLRAFLSTPTSRGMEQRGPISEVDLRRLIQSFKMLRILDLHAVIFKKVPRSICKLKHLTYLDLSHNNALKRLPNSIRKLQNLQTLNLQGCFALEELPRGIKKLVNLRNLDIDHCNGLSYVPRGLRQLSSLHRLTRFILPKGKALAKNYCGLEELNGLNDLTGSLRIENLGHLRDAFKESKAACKESKVGNLIEKHSLESLTLKWGYLDTSDAENGDVDEALLDGLKPHSNLQKLTMDEYEGKSFPNWMLVSLVDFLPKLVEVRFLRCRRCKHLPQLGRLPQLKSLEIWRLTELESIESDHSPPSTSSFSCLSKLEISYCENLKAMPQTPHLEDLSLREVNQEFFNRIIGPNKLKSLDISHMDFLEYLPKECLQSLTSLERLSISECPRLTSFSGMQHLPNLVRLSFSNCEELDLSKGESNVLDLQRFKRLRFMDIHGVPKLASLPQWLLWAYNLEHLSIKKCFNLKALPDQIEALKSLQQLEIIRCPSLTSLPAGMQRLRSLSHLKIAGCPNLEERCKKDVGEDWKKIFHIPHRTHKLEYYERYL